MTLLEQLEELVNENGGFAKVLEQFQQLIYAKGDLYKDNPEKRNPWISAGKDLDSAIKKLKSLSS